MTAHRSPFEKWQNSVLAPCYCPTCPSNLCYHCDYLADVMRQARPAIGTGSLTLTLAASCSSSSWSSINALPLYRAVPCNDWSHRESSLPSSIGFPSGTEIAMKMLPIASSFRDTDSPLLGAHWPPLESNDTRAHQADGPVIRILRSLVFDAVVDAARLQQQLTSDLDRKNAAATRVRFDLEIGFRETTYTLPHAVTQNGSEPDARPS